MAEAVLNQQAQVDKGENARMASFVGALAISDLVKSTLGPKGMDKILQSMTMQGQITITNDGATILKSIHIDIPNNFLDLFFYFSYSSFICICIH